IHIHPVLVLGSGLPARLDLRTGDPVTEQPLVPEPRDRTTVDAPSVMRIAELPARRRTRAVRLVRADLRGRRIDPRVDVNWISRRRLSRQPSRINRHHQLAAHYTHRRVPRAQPVAVVIHYEWLTDLNRITRRHELTIAAGHEP